MRVGLGHDRWQDIPELEGVGVRHRRVVVGLCITAGNERYEGGDIGANLLSVAIFQVSADLEGFLQVGE